MPQKCAQDLNSKVGQQIRILRKALGLSQSDLANELNMSYQQVQRYESGKSNISLSLVEKLADVLGTGVSEIIYDNITQQYTGKASSKPPPKEILEIVRCYSEIESESVRKFLRKYLRAVIEDISKLNSN